MSNDRRAAVKKLKNLYFSPKTDINEYRQRMDEVFSSNFLPNNVDFEEKVYSSIKCDVLSPEIYSSNRILIYVHGGSFVGGSRSAYRPFVSALANVTASRAFLPEFRLAPAHPFPAALEDLEKFFDSVYSETENAIALSASGEGFSKNPQVIFAADTSGASIALGFLYRLNEKIRENVSQVILFSPWLDFSEDNDMFTAKKVSDEIFNTDFVRLCSEHYTYQENWKNPLVSPLKAGRELLQKFPPVFIQMGEKEIFYDDAIMFQSMLRNYGHRCELDTWKGMMPMFQLADEYLCEAHLALEKVGKVITEQNHKDESVREIQLTLERP